MLTSGDVVAISRVSLKVLRAWCERGLVPNLGRGNHRQFSKMQLLGVVVGATLHRLAQTQANRDAAYTIAKYIGSLSEAKLLRAFGEGRTYLLPRTDGPCLLVTPPSSASKGGPFDLLTAYEQTNRLLEDLKASTPRTVRRGRKTGLAAGG